MLRHRVYIRIQISLLFIVLAIEIDSSVVERVLHLTGYDLRYWNKYDCANGDSIPLNHLVHRSKSRNK